MPELLSAENNHSLVIFLDLLLNSRNLSLDIECWFLKLIASEFPALIWIIPLYVSRLFCILFYFILSVLLMMYDLFV